MDWIQFLQALMALVFVLGLLFLTTWGIKYIEQKSRFLKKINKKDRLNIVEIKRIDTKNMLVLIQRDDTQHLILVGQNSQVIETNIPLKEEGKINEK